MNNLESTDIITTSSRHGIKSGDYFEVCSVSGVRKEVLKTTAVNSTTLTYRHLRWYESGWYRVKAWLRRIYIRLLSRIS